jgi:DNA polymerase I-like protein with 3'-5' exonuclease and polymerase domains
MKKFAIALVEPPLGAKELFSDFAVIAIQRQMVQQILEDGEIDAIAFFSTSILNAVMPRHNFTVEEKSFNYRVFPFHYPQNKKLCICLPEVLPGKFSEGEKVAETPLLKFAIAELKEALKDFNYLQIPDYAETDVIDVLMNEEAATEWVQKCTGKICALDYETTGLNPYRDGHRIVSASIAIKENDKWQSKGFNFYAGEKFVSAFKTFLRKSKIICHNIAFEADWSLCCAGEELENFFHDTMIAQHCIDNNAFVGLKLWVYLYFGIVYEVPFEISAIDGEFNQMKNFPVGSVPSKILWYNALDSLYTGWIFDKQVEFFKKNRNLQSGFFLFMDAAKELWQAHKKGIRLDEEALKKAFETSYINRDAALQKVYAHDWVRKWKRGMWDITKTQHLKDIIKINAGIEMEKLEEGDLQKVPGDFCKLVIEYRKNEKLRGTYLEQFARENCNGVIHPQYHLHKVVTYRTSSSNPNFQNIPKRDKEMKKAIRGVLFPSKGNQIMEWDYKGVEVAISACYNKDPELLRYLREKGTDMHRDTAAVLFRIKPEDVSKEQRQLAKNNFVFPIFYGATFASMAQNLWENMKPEWKKSLGMTKFEQFEAHVKKVEDNWWQRRFPVYGKWRKDVYSKFIEDGCIDYYTGFRAFAPAGFTELVNRPIQGSACHCLLWTMIKAGKRIRGLSGRSAIIGQIHDSIIGDIHPEEENQCNEIIREEGIINLRNEWKWIIAPLEIEVAKAPADGAWNLLEDYLKLEAG